MGRALGSGLRATSEHVMSAPMLPDESRRAGVPPQVQDVIVTCRVWTKRLHPNEACPAHAADSQPVDVRLRSVVNKPRKLAADAWVWCKNAASEAWRWLRSAASDAWRWLKSAAQWLCTGWRWLVVVAAVAAAIAVVTLVVGLRLTRSYEDSTHRWVAWTAILAAATLVVALLGLPFALYQLATLRRDLDQVTRTGQFERGLRALMLRGLDLLERLQRDDTAYARAEFTGWIDGVAGYIRRETNDELEEKFFRIEGKALPPQQQLEAKIRYLREKIIPELRAAYR
jgi:hypothetical protein